jgi:hypothetical protein
MVEDHAGCDTHLAHGGEAAFAFRRFKTLGTREIMVFVAAWPMAHTLVYLRIADAVTDVGARLTTGLGGLAPGRAGFAPAGRRTKFRELIASFTPLRPALPGRTESPISQNTHITHPICSAEAPSAVALAVQVVTKVAALS